MGKSDEEGRSESSITLKMGVVMTLVLGFFGWLLVTQMLHEKRISDLEAQLKIYVPMITDQLDVLNKTTREIRDDQIRIAGEVVKIPKRGSSK